KIFEWQKRHEVGVMHDERFGRALYQIALSGMSGNDVTNGVKHSAFQRESNAYKRMPQRLSALTLTAFAVRPKLILEQFANIGQNRPSDHHICVHWQGSTHEALHRLRALAGNMHYAALVLHKADRAIWDQQRERDLVQVFRLKKTALEGFDPGLGNLLPKRGILDPVNLRPYLFYGFAHDGVRRKLHRLAARQDPKRRLGSQ